jgi:hypothetical protein
MTLIASFPGSPPFDFGLTRNTSIHIKPHDTSTPFAGPMLQLWIFLDFPCDKSEIRLKPTKADFSVTNISQTFENTIDLQL